MAAKKKDPYSTQGLNDKASVQQALASAQYQPGEAVNNAASALEQWQASRPGAYQSQYQGQINDLLDQACTRRSSPTTMRLTRCTASTPRPTGRTPTTPAPTPRPRPPP